MMGRRSAASNRARPAAGTARASTTAFAEPTTVIPRAKPKNVPVSTLPSGSTRPDDARMIASDRPIDVASASPTDSEARSSSACWRSEARSQIAQPATMLARAISTASETPTTVDARPRLLTGRSYHTAAGATGYAGERRSRRVREAASISAPSRSAAPPSQSQTSVTTTADSVPQVFSNEPKEAL